MKDGLYFLDLETTSFLGNKLKMGKKNKAKTRKYTQASPSPDLPASTAKNKTEPYWLLLLIGITVLCFYPMLKNNFVNWDDDFYVLNNALLHGPDWKGIFTTGVSSNYHPLTVLTLAINYMMSGTDAWSYLFFNLVLHIVNVILVYKFIFAISDKKIMVAFFTALIFGIHPMHVESVAWVSERKDVLYTLFFVLSLMQYWKFLQTNKQKYLWVCFLFFALSLLSKPAAIILPAVLLLLDYWNRRTFHKRLLLEKIPFFLLATVFVIITLKLQSDTAIKGLETFPLWTRFFYACYCLMIYFVRFFIPYPLSAYHPFPPNENLGIDVYISPLFIIGLAAITWYLRKNRFFVFGILFFVVNLLLVIQIITIGSTLISERYTYVPYIGLAFIIGMWFDRTAISKQLNLAVCAVLGLVFGYLTFQRTHIWKDSISLWTDVINRFPNAPLPRNQRAIFLGQLAYRQTDQAIANDLLQKALDDCNAALKAKPDHAVTLINRQNIYLKMNRNEEALADAESVARLEPDNYIPYFTKGKAYSNLNENDSAVSAYRKCLSLNPDQDEAWNNLGNLLMRKYQQFDEAMTDFNKAISLNPSGLYYADRSVCYYNKGDKENARIDALNAIEKGINVPENYRKALNIE